MVICTLGDLLLDVIVRLQAPLARGGDAPAATLIGAGGQAANVAAWVAHLGGTARFVGVRSGDAAGMLVAEELERRGVERARTPTLVVSAGIKSLLDVAATCEVLETIGVPVVGWRTDTLPLFYAAHGGPQTPARVESAHEVAAVAAAHWALGGRGLVLARPPDESLDDVESLIEEAIAAATRLGNTGQAVTPFVLARLHECSGGRTLTANRALIVANARLAATIAAEMG